MDYKLRPYQFAAIHKVFEFFSENKYGKMLVVSPTGTGKSIMQLALRDKIKAAAPKSVVHIITPWLSIVRDYLTKMGYDVDEMSFPRIRKIAASHDIYTYGSYRNKLIKGEIAPPHVLIGDEAHHLKLGNTITDQIFWDASVMKIVGFTATGFRATPKSTTEFREEWDLIYEAITIQQALRQQYWKMPHIKIIGCIDDDVLTVKGGEFRIKTMGDLEECAAETTFETIARILRKHSGSKVVGVSSTDISKELCAYLNAVNIPAHVITHETKDKERVIGLNKLAKAESTLIHINIVGEGFDLPDLEVYVDAAPTMSPVKFIQGPLGRLSRWSTVEKYLYSLCRNVERFAYLMEGIIPTATVVEAQNAFITASTRQGARVFGVEKLGRLKPLLFQRKDKVFGSFYLISSFNAVNAEKVLYAVILNPEMSKPIVMSRKDRRLEHDDPSKSWSFGKWKLAEMPGESFKGFSTEKKPRKLSDKQLTVWARNASRCGLNPDRKVDHHEFQMLFILMDSGVKL